MDGMERRKKKWENGESSEEEEKREMDVIRMWRKKLQNGWYKDGMERGVKLKKQR